MIGIEDGDIVGKIEVGCRDHAWALLAKRQQNVRTTLETKDHALEI